MASENTNRVAAYERLTRLPTFHPTAVKLLALSTEADSAIADFEGIFQADLTLTADLLLTANSAAYGLRARVDTIKHALTLLGLERVRSLACNITWGAYLGQQTADILRPVWQHSIATAIICEILGGIYNVPGLYTAGLLHDLGRLGLLLSAGQRYAETLAKETTDVEEAIKREAMVCGINHCEAGALLAQTWGFPELLQVAMVEHHGHSPVGSGRPIGLIQTACRMADWLGFPELHSAPGTPPDLPQRVLDSPNLEPQRVRELINKQTAILNS